MAKLIAIEYLYNNSYFSCDFSLNVLIGEVYITNIMNLMTFKL